MIIFLSLKYFTVFSSMKLLIGYSKSYLLEIGCQVQIIKSIHAMGRRKLAFTRNGGREVKFSPFYSLDILENVENCTFMKSSDKLWEIQKERLKKHPSEGKVGE